MKPETSCVPDCARYLIPLEQKVNNMTETIDHSVVELGSSIVSFQLDPEITAALDKAASQDLDSRSAFIRKLIIRHLQGTGAIRRELQHIGKGPRRRTRR
jgi:hypothetical protein